MALQLLKRGYVMQNWEQPRILKLPQGEERQTRATLPIDLGDWFDNLRFDNNKLRFIQDSVSKYAQSNDNPYGTWGQPYKIKTFRPPIIDPIYYEPLSRIPVKMQPVGSGPIVSDLYKKQIEIGKIAPKSIIDRVCAETDAAPSAPHTRQYQPGLIELTSKLPRASIPYWPSMPVYNTVIPEQELDGKIFTRANAGIHGPFVHSDQSRDINNMRTPTHTAFKPGYKAPGQFVTINPEQVPAINNSRMHSSINTPVAPAPTVDNLTRVPVDLDPKVRTSAWYNPSYYTGNVGYSQGGETNCATNKVRTSAAPNPNWKMIDQPEIQPARVRENLSISKQSNVSWLDKNGDLGQITLDPAMNLGSWDSSHGDIPSIQEHQTFNRAKQTTAKDYYMVQSGIPNQNYYHNNEMAIQGVRDKQNYSVDSEKNVIQSERIIPTNSRNFAGMRI
jgi:hypothetical protein